MRINIKLFLLLNTLIFGLVGCSNQLADSDKVIIIDNQLTPKHVRFKGTKTFLALPKEYIFDKIDPQFSNQNGSTIRVLEFKDKKFIIDDYTKERGDYLGMTIHEWYKVKVHNMEGVMLFSDNREDPSLDKGMLIFGDSLQTTLVLAKFMKQNRLEKQTINKIFKSVVKLNSYKFYPLELALFKIDLSKTNFKFCTNVTNTFTFTFSGQGNPNMDIELSRIDITQYTKLSSLKEAENFVNNILSTYIKEGYTLSDTKSTSYRIGSINYFETISKGSYNGKSNLIYILLLQGESGTLMFHGMSYTEYEKYLEIFKTTSKTLEFK